VIVFVHGVGETAAIWTDMRRVIGRESIALSLPGFGCRRPASFNPTMNDYAQWLAGELEKIGGPIDLVGHDWGAGFTYRVAAKFGHQLRSWCGDIGNVFHPRYEWHSFAKLWQTKGEGENYFANQILLRPKERASLYEDSGLDPAQAIKMAGELDAIMARCTLDLYRSAMPNPHHQWGPWTPTNAPGLVLHAIDDPLGHEGLAREVAISLGARFKRIANSGHFWPCQQPTQTAAILKSFWASIYDG